MATATELGALWHFAEADAFHLPGKHDQSTHGHGSAKEFNRSASQAATGQAALDAAGVGLPDPDGTGGKGLGDLSDQQVRALHYFRGEGYRQVTPALYRGKPRPQVAERISHLDAAMAHSRLDRDVVTYRGVTDIRRLVGARAERGNLTGAKWTDRAFLSTSTERRLAHNFSRKGAAVSDTRPTVLRYLVPKGSHAVKLSSSRHESELLLDRGSSFRVVADHGQIDGARYLDVEVT